jgi:hypothetical protein
MLALAVIGDRLDGTAKLTHGLALIVAISAVLVVWQERLANAQALGLASTWLALAFAIVWLQRTTPVSGASCAKL